MGRENLSDLRDTPDGVSSDIWKTLKFPFQVFVILTTWGITVWDLHADWRVWVVFRERGISEEPLIPPTSSWMDFWVAFCAVATLLALLGVINDIIGLIISGISYCSDNDPPREGAWLCLYGCSCATRREVISLLYLLFKSIPLIILSYFYFVVQEDCRQLNNIDEVFLSEISTTLRVLWHFFISIYWLFRRFGWCCNFCYPTSKNALGPSEVCQFDPDYNDSDTCKTIHKCCLFPVFYITSLAFHLLVVVAGVVVFALTADLLNISSTNQPEILRSNPPMPVLNVTAIVANGNMSIVEEFPILDPDEAFLLGPLTCFAVFKYDESSSTILLNFAFVNRNATALNETCDCVPNDSNCQPLYEPGNLFYGFSQPDSQPTSQPVSPNFQPYSCFARSYLIGISRDNFPQLDSSLPVDCEC